MLHGPLKAAAASCRVLSAFCPAKFFANSTALLLFDSNGSRWQGSSLTRFMPELLVKLVINRPMNVTSSSFVLVVVNYNDTIRQNNLSFIG